MVSGTVRRSAKLPTERQLAERYAASVPTVREAIRGLAARAALTRTRALTGELRRALERLEVAISADPNAPSFGTLMARALPCGPWPMMHPSTQPWVMHHQSPGSNTWDYAAPNLP